MIIVVSVIRKDADRSAGRCCLDSVANETLQRGPHLPRVGKGKATMRDFRLPAQIAIGDIIPKMPDQLIYNKPEIQDLEVWFRWPSELHQVRQYFMNAACLLNDGLQRFAMSWILLKIDKVLSLTRYHR